MPCFGNQGQKSIISKKTTHGFRVRQSTRRKRKVNNSRRNKGRKTIAI